MLIILMSYQHFYFITYLRHKTVKTYLISGLTILYLNIKGKNQLFRGTEFD